MPNGLDALHSAVAIASILEDARFVVRTAIATQQGSDIQRSVLALAMLPSFGIITHETRKWLKQHRPDVAATLPDEELEFVEDIRNASKWFDASKGGQEEAIRRFEELTAAHAQRFFGNTPYLWARELETDLGLYKHEGVDILNTHLVGTILGADVLERGPVVGRMAATMTGQASALIGGIDEGSSFVDELSEFKDHDVRSAEYYQVAGLHLPESGYLHILWSTLAFLELMHPRLPDDEGAIFKLKFVGLYHATHAVHGLAPGLAPRHWLVDGDAPRQLRNDLVHYSPIHSHPASALDSSRPRQALVEHAFGRSFAEVAEEVSMQVKALHTRLGSRLGRQSPRNFDHI